MEYLSLVPAYGRDYKNRAEVLAAWAAGHDFLIKAVGHKFDEKYINRPEHPPNTTLNIRYKKLTQICVIKPPKTP